MIEQATLIYRNGRTRPNAALIALADDLPVAVVHEMLGVSIAAAVKWARRAGRDWNGYISVLVGNDAQ